MLGETGQGDEGMKRKGSRIDRLSDVSFRRGDRRKKRHRAEINCPYEEEGTPEEGSETVEARFSARNK
jgi:hypothetical protein